MLAEQGLFASPSSASTASAQRRGSAARVAQLASVGDMAGVQRMQEIAAKLDELTDAGRA